MKNKKTYNIIGETDFNLSSDLLKTEERDNNSEFKTELSDKLEIKLDDGKYENI